jgi:hydrophobe/amphiphile efflux-3 (HAE3) family protein
VLQLVFAPSLGAEVPKPRFSYVFPNKDAAVIEARLRPGLGDSERKRAIAMVKEAVRSQAFKLKFGSYVVSGRPVVTEKVASTLSGTLALLLAAVAVVMVVTLLAVFRTRRGLLPLALALAAAAIAFGVMSLTGGSLTIASIAVLPVLTGLAVAYAMPFQTRFDERRRESAPSGAGAPSRPGDAAASAAARSAEPVIATAWLATAAALLVLLLSPVPMVRSFGAMLVLGLVLALAITVTAGPALVGADPPVTTQLGRRFAALGRRKLERRGGLPSAPARVASRLGFVSGPRAFGRRTALVLRKWGGWGFDRAITKPRRVLFIGVAVAALGWLAGTQTEVVSDLTRLVPQDQREVRDLETLQRETSTSGDVSVLVKADDLADPRVIAWMADYQRRVLERHGYRDDRPCRQAQLCPALSLTNLFGGRPPQTRREAQAFFDSLPRSFAENVVTPDRRTGNISFGVRVMPLDDQKDLIDDMRSQLDPPPGVHAELAGPPVLATESHSDLESSRWILGLAALAVVFLVLIAVYRRAERAIVPLVPIALATGWSSLVLFLLQISLDPLSAALGAIVVAISAGFSVLLASRYRQERAAGLAPRAALERTYRESGPAMLASSATATAGFATLIVSDIKMLRDFGFVTVIDLGVVLLGVMLVLPAALMVAEEGLRLPRTRAEAFAAVRSAGARVRLTLGAAGRAIRGVPGYVRRAVPAAGRRLRASAPFRK